MLRRFPRRWDACAAAAFTFAGALAEPQRACQLAAQAVALQPELPTAWIYRGEVNLMAGQATAAVTALQRGWELLRDGEGSELAVRAAYRLFAAHDALGDTAAARTWATRTLHLAREYALLEPATGHYWLAQALEATGDRAGARAAYAQALQASLFYPEREVAMEALLEEYAERATERPPGSSPIGNKRQR